MNPFVAGLLIGFIVGCGVCISFALGLTENERRRKP